MEQEKNCTKTQYMSETFANIEIKRIRSTSKREKIPKRAYKCDDCGYWHLTSLSDKKEVRKPKEMVIMDNQKAIIETLKEKNNRLFEQINGLKAEISKRALIVKSQAKVILKQKEIIKKLRNE
jgi:hypothetical protein